MSEGPDEKDLKEVLWIADAVLTCRDRLGEPERDVHRLAVWVRHLALTRGLLQSEVDYRRAADLTGEEVESLRRLRASVVSAHDFASVLDKIIATSRGEK